MAWILDRAETWGVLAAPGTTGPRRCRTCLPSAGQSRCPCCFGTSSSILSRCWEFIPQCSAPPWVDGGTIDPAFPAAYRAGSGTDVLQGPQQSLPGAALSLWAAHQAMQPWECNLCNKPADAACDALLCACTLPFAVLKEAGQELLPHRSVLMVHGDPACSRPHMAWSQPPSWRSCSGLTQIQRAAAPEWMRLQCHMLRAQEPRAQEPAALRPWV